MAGTDKPDTLCDADLDVVTGGAKQHDLDNGRLTSEIGVALGKDYHDSYANLETSYLLDRTSSDKADIHQR